MIQTFITAFFSFVSTNIDDIFILMLLLAQAKDSVEAVQIITGQYLGLTFLTVVSILGALGTQLIPSKYIGLLGFVPLFLGIRQWLAYSREDSYEMKDGMRISVISVMLLTIANGADNIGVYIPVFSGFSVIDFIITMVIFAVMTALWCCLGIGLSGHPYIKEKINRYKHILVPLIFIALGCAILAENYVF